MTNRLVRERIRGIDAIRGLIMVIMALDHTRDFLHFQGKEFAPTNMATTTVTLFFTRWITHFCAPTFVLLSGISSSLAGQKRTQSELAAFLFKRGLWLVITDLVVISLLFTFDIRFHMLVLEVLWAIGFGMMTLGLLIALRAPVALIGGIGCLLLFGHNGLDHIQPPGKTLPGYLLTFLLTGRGALVPIGSDRMIGLLYPALIWSSVLLIGYMLGSLYTPGFAAERRKKVLLLSGAGLVLLFIALRLMNGYGDPSPWSPQRNAAHTLLSFLNTTKQPPSLLYLAMTLGPVLIGLALVEKSQGRLTRFFSVYGNVPYFYFLAHLALLRMINILLILAMGVPMKSDGSPLVWQAQDFGIPLGWVYVIWGFVVAALYYPCNRYGQYKKTHGAWWISYL